MASMTMSDREISRNWRNSDKSSKQIAVLAELNDVSVVTMKCKLIDLNLITKAQAKDNRWTAEEEAVILKLVPQGYTDAEIGKIINRTKTAVKHRRRELLGEHY